MSGSESFVHEPPVDHAELLARVRFSLDQPMRVSEAALGQRAETFAELRGMTRSSCVRVTARLMPAVHGAVVRACANLLLPEEPEVYIAADPQANASALTDGSRYFIRLHSGLVQLLEPAELQSVVGHEIAHATMRHLIENPENDREATFALERRRAQEISADRVGLLAVDSPADALRAEVKVACGLDARHFTADLDAFIEQISTPPDDLDSEWEANSTHPTLALRFWAQRHFMESDLFLGLKGAHAQPCGRPARPFDEVEREIEERFHGVGSSHAFRATADHVHESLAWLGILAVATDGELCDQERTALRDIVGHIWADDAFAYARRHGILAVERRARETLAPLRFSNDRSRRRVETALRELVDRASAGHRLEELLRLIDSAMRAP
jgi:hypothetical protein